MIQTTTNYVKLLLVVSLTGFP